MAPFFIIISFYLFGVLSEKSVSKPRFTFAENYPRTSEYALGDDITLNCYITDLGDYSVTWRKGEDGITPNDRHEFKLDEDEGEPDEEGGCMKNLIIKNLQAEDAGNYICQIDTDPPQAITHILKIVNSEIISTNQTFKANVGDTVILPCDVKDVGSYKVVWLKKNPKDDQYSDINGDEEISLSDDDDDDKKVVIIQRHKVTIALGTGKCDDPYTHIATDKEIAFGLGNDNMEIVDGYNLKISNLNTDNSGTYYCSLRNVDRNKSFRVISHELEVDRAVIQIPPTGEPTFLSYGYKHQFAVRDNIRMPCAIANLGNHSVTWKKGDEVITFNDRLFLHEYQDIKKEKYDLNIGPLSVEDSGNYTCEINTEPPKTLTHTLMVLEPRILTTNQTFKVAVGETVVLPCDTKDLGETSYVVWKKEDGTFVAIMLPEPVIPPEFLLEPMEPVNKDSKSLELRNVTFKHAGLYICSIVKIDASFPPNALIGHKLEVVDKKNTVLEITEEVFHNVL